MKISKTCAELVKAFEGDHLIGYLCPAGVPTIGWGHTGSVDGEAIHVGMKISEEKALELFFKDMEVFEKRVVSFVKVELQQHQFDALVSFDFNTGGLGKSTLLRKLNAGEDAADEFLRWNKVHGEVCGGLVRRRKAERHLFLTGERKTDFSTDPDEDPDEE